MNEKTEFRLYMAGIEEELKHMNRVCEEMKDNIESPLKDSAFKYLEQLRLEYSCLKCVEN